MQSLGARVGTWAPTCPLGFSCDLLVALSRCSPHASLSPVFGPGQLVAGCHRISLPCRDTVDSDQFKREEDFYYTEVQMKGEAAAAGGPTADPAPTPSVTSPPDSPRGHQHLSREAALPGGSPEAIAPASPVRKLEE